MRPEDWIETRPEGLRVIPGGFFVDPVRAVDRAVITHGHSDHARAGHGAVLATAETLAIMRARAALAGGQPCQALGYGEGLRVGEVTVRLAPAGHVLGSAQAILEHKGQRVVVSGDYKRRPDPTCAPFQPVPCDVFITEATFGLPVFRHPDDKGEIAKLLKAREANPDRCVLVGVYALGKAQRVMALLRQAGYDRPLFIHGALKELCALYEAHGVALGDTRSIAGLPKAALAGEIVLAPPSAGADRWTRRLPDPMVAMASGWMGVRQRAKQRGVELPLVISDHADWDELIATLSDVGAPEVWVTHGREEALIHQAAASGIRARALSLVGFEEEGA